MDKDLFALNDTISAISTPPGEGGIGIIRISGPASITIAKEIFRDKTLKVKDKFKSHRVMHGYIVNPATKEKIDEVLLTPMLSPHSFTREDVVEIGGHGGFIPLQNILSLIISQGARLARPGEFTQRAFLNGRIDLTQVEAVIDIIRSSSEAGLKTAVQQLAGNLGKKIKSLRQKLINLCARIEAEIDFPEDNLGIISPEALSENLEKLLKETGELIHNFEQGRMLREGISAVIIGKPNVGKSTLLNTLLKEERAIVTPLAGTTRDLIKEEVRINGLVFKLIDTAGLRNPRERIESEGIKKTWRAINKAELILFVLDGSRPFDSDDLQIMEKIGHKKVIYLINKIDLPLKIGYNKLKKICPLARLRKISAKDGRGIKEIEKEMSGKFRGPGSLSKQSVLINRLHHRESLVKAEANLKNALRALKDNLSFEFIALDLKTAGEDLGEITGETFREEILNKIFSEFCIGK